MVSKNMKYKIKYINIIMLFSIISMLMAGCGNEIDSSNNANAAGGVIMQSVIESTRQKKSDNSFSNLFSDNTNLLIIISIGVIIAIIVMIICISCYKTNKTKKMLNMRKIDAERKIMIMEQSKTTNPPQQESSQIGQVDRVDKGAEMGPQAVKFD